MHQSIPPAPSPRLPPCPRADPWVLAFFLPWIANSRGWGLLSCQISRGEDEKRGQMPRPPSTLQHLSFIDLTIELGGGGVGWCHFKHFNVQFFVSVYVFLCNSARILTILTSTRTSLWF